MEVLERLRTYFADYANVDQVKMFGGVCFLVDRAICCGVLQGSLVLRVGKKNYQSSLLNREMEALIMGGRQISNFVLIDEEYLLNDEDLFHYIAIAEGFLERSRL